MVGDVAGSVEVFLNECRRQNECVANVGEAFTGGAVDGKLTGR
jgi:hypothetical protein